MMDANTKTIAIPGPVVEVDLSRPLPLVLIEGAVLQGVTRAVIEIDAGEMPVLVLRLLRFDVKGGTLPNVIGRYRKEQGE